MKRIGASAAAVLWALAAMADAQAAGGRITFSGSIVVPTCSPTVPAPARAASGEVRSHCPDAATPASYTLRYEPATSHPRSQLVAYYADYVRAAGGAPVWVATQIYD